MSITMSKRRNWDSEECLTKQDQNSVRKTPNPPATWSMLEHLHFYLLFLLLDLLPLPVYSTSWHLSPGTNTSSTLGALHNTGFLSTASQDYLSGTLQPYSWPHGLWALLNHGKIAQPPCVSFITLKPEPQGQIRQQRMEPGPFKRF